VVIRILVVNSEWYWCAICESIDQDGRCTHAYECRDAVYDCSDCCVSDWIVVEFVL